MEEGLPSKELEGFKDGRRELEGLRIELGARRRE